MMYLDKVGKKHEKNKCVYTHTHTHTHAHIKKKWDSLKMPKSSFKEFCQPKRAHLECYLIHWWEECVRQQRKVNCWYWRGGSWTLVEDLCLCLLVKLSVEDNSKERGKEIWSIKYIFSIISTYNWATTIIAYKKQHKLATEDTYYCHLLISKGMK